MTREEEIRQASENYGNQKYSDGINALICAEDFKEGVNWADKHPRKGLWDAEKVIKFIKEELPHYVELNCVFDEIQVNYNKFKNNFIHDLKRAMEN